MFFISGHDHSCSVSVICLSVSLCSHTHTHIHTHTHTHRNTTFNDLSLQHRTEWSTRDQGFLANNTGSFPPFPKLSPNFLSPHPLFHSYKPPRFWQLGSWMPPNINLHRDTELHQEIPDLTEASEGYTPSEAWQGIPVTHLRHKQREGIWPTNKPFLPQSVGPQRSGDGTVNSNQCLVGLHCQW